MGGSLRITMARSQFRGTTFWMSPAASLVVPTVTIKSETRVVSRPNQT